MARVRECTNALAGRDRAVLEALRPDEGIPLQSQSVGLRKIEGILDAHRHHRRMFHDRHSESLSGFAAAKVRAAGVAE